MLQNMKMRDELKIPQDLKPWTTLPDRRFTGMMMTPRVRCCLDLALLQYLGPAGATRIQATGDTSPVEELFVDTSQNPIRKAFTNSENITKCLTTATTLYSFGRDRQVLGKELLVMQGHTKDVVIPASMKPDAVRDLAGEGICLPCLGLLIAGMMVTGTF